MQTYIMYGGTLLLLLLSLWKDKGKTRMALKKAWKSLENILPQFLGIIVLVGILLAVVDADFISSVLGSSSGWTGVVLASLIGAVTLIPAFVAFPTAAMLLQGGAGYTQIGVFISTLMMVGMVTLPLEARYFGKKTAIFRNLLAYLFSFVVALVIGKVMGEL